ncbi:MAG: acetyl-CoA carboxylase biotin carboxyl carrier protein [Candidatus Aminicenantes bacterium]|nr:acetyl-CoA carboxylase biotin carboxyl carrier protein [Candidatus Aminicenantes bacterium]
MSQKIDYKEITKLIDLLEERRISEFELEVVDFKVKISRGPKAPVFNQPYPASAPAPNDENTSTAETVRQDEARGGLHIIRSPMVGTFYRSPDPSSPPFVEIGETALTGKTLCIIEAMKLMNEIESDIEGEVEEIYLENGQSVEYGQKLFGIKAN